MKIVPVHSAHYTHRFNLILNFQGMGMVKIRAEKKCAPVQRRQSTIKILCMRLYAILLYGK